MEKVMATREDYLVCRSLLTDGTVSYEELTKLLNKWEKGPSKSFLDFIVEEGIITEEEKKGLELCTKALIKQREDTISLAKLDYIICQIIIKKNLVPTEEINKYQKRNTLKGTFTISEALVRDGLLPKEIYEDIKKKAESIFYRRRLIALARGKEKLTGIFHSPGKEERVSGKIQKLIISVKAEKNKFLKKRGGNVPKLFGKYEIIEEIASGGMGIVYKAIHKDLGRIVALKILHEEKEESSDRVKRFLREAKAGKRLKHPNIVGIHDVGTFQGRHYLSMDYIDGVPMNVLIRSNLNIDLEDYLNIIAELSRAIHYAHEQGIIHRDLKPANIIIDRDGHPQITDFGLAKILDSNTRLTQSDTIIGTPFYMAPEQTRGENTKIGPATDIWAIGVILYEIITKRLPFMGRTSVELYHKINHMDPVPPRKINPNIPKEIEYITLKALSKDIEDRYKTAEELADDIERYLDGKEIIMKDLPPWLKKIKRWVRENKWLLLIALAAIILGWLCGWYLLSQVQEEGKINEQIKEYNEKK